ncbi:MAG TPA: serpin family protein [Planctomycetota bacterium]|nr:serpin family protein [Planctomycetota bacterium]
MMLRTILALALISGIAHAAAIKENLPVAATEAEIKQQTEGNNAFAADIYKALSKEKGNLFLSPSSLSTALAMTYAGARTETAAEMKKTLHFVVADERLHPVFGAIIRNLNSDGKGYELVIANRLWGQKDYPFHPDFLRVTQVNYGAAIDLLNIASDPEGSRKIINAWVEKQTREKIKDLLQPDSIRGASLVLTNAIYFKGKWANPFKPEQTKEAPFFAPSGEVKVPLMEQKAELPYAKLEDGTQIVELPYAGGSLAMDVIVPAAKDGLAALEAKLTHKDLTQWLGSLQPQENIHVFLPRFKVEFGKDVKDELMGMGMVLAFDVKKSDFSGMEPKKELYISKVIHKAFVDVNEEGTEAAAATAVVMAPRGMAPKPQIVRADHPFLFLIRDTKSGAILFSGRLVEPK